VLVRGSWNSPSIASAAPRGRSTCSQRLGQYLPRASFKLESSKVLKSLVASSRGCLGPGTQPDFAPRAKDGSGWLTSQGSSNDALTRPNVSAGHGEYRPTPALSASRDLFTSRDTASRPRHHKAYSVSASLMVPPNSSLMTLCDSLLRLQMNRHVGAAQ
jgi:hypothetical protein